MVITFKDFPNIGNYFGREDRKGEKKRLPKNW